MIAKSIKNIFFVLILSLSSNCFSYPGDSVYNLNSDLIDKNGATYKLGDLNGKVQVLSMIYTRCKTICPIIIANMKAIEKLLPEEVLDKVQFSLISLDPDKDSVSTLTKFSEEKKMTNRWNLFKTTKEETLKIALALGIKYKKENNDEYTHSNLIIILDKEGVIKLHHQGLDKNYSNVIKLIKDLSRQS